MEEEYKDLRYFKENGYAAYRWKCDYENCKRILSDETARENEYTRKNAIKGKASKCTSCGHGWLEKEFPKNYCCICHQPIYFNIRSDREVECGMCTQMAVLDVEREKQSQYSGEQLKELRKELRFSQNSLAGKLKISRQTYSKMERDIIPLNTNAIALLEAHEIPKIDGKDVKWGALLWEPEIVNMEPKPYQLPTHMKMSESKENKVLCEKCGEYKDDWDITIKCLTPYVTKAICFQCLGEAKTAPLGR